jgi:hypothetical protein
MPPYPFRKYIWILSSFFLLAACNDYKEVREQMVHDTLNEKLDGFRYKERTDCKEEALRVAAKMVDSMLIARAKASKDSLNKPPIPAKPVRPNQLSPMDSSEVGPILTN